MTEQYAEDDSSLDHSAYANELLNEKEPLGFLLPPQFRAEPGDLTLIDDTQGDNDGSSN